MTQYPEAQRTGIWYAEDRCAVRWPLSAQLVFWSVVFVAGNVLVWGTWDPNWSLVLAIGFAGVAFSVILLAGNWPTGIRIGADGIRIGGVRRTHVRPARLPHAGSQRKQVFFCPWDAVRRVEVITDRARLPGRRDASLGGVLQLGVFWAPFSRAVLEMHVDPRGVGIPEFRPPDEGRSWFKVSDVTQYELSAVWSVPTRRPDALRAVLSEHAVSIR